MHKWVLGTRLRGPVDPGGGPRDPGGLGSWGARECDPWGPGAPRQVRVLGSGKIVSRKGGTLLGGAMRHPGESLGLWVSLVERDLEIWTL